MRRLLPLAFIICFSCNSNAEKLTTNSVEVSDYGIRLSVPSTFTYNIVDNNSIISIIPVESTKYPDVELKIGYNDLCFSWRDAYLMYSNGIPGGGSGI